jgi:threonine/homoserine/homoserine lactone efflux protein
VGVERVIPDPSNLALFVVAALALLLVPGPAVLYVVARSIHQGRRAGLASVLGIHVGTLVHIAAATVGLSALLVSSSIAFTVVKVAGAVYLVGLGLWTLFSRRAEPEVALGGERNLRRAFAQGIVVNVLNPKTALFFLAFLPQFVDTDASHPAVQIALLGLLFALLGLVTDSLWAIAAGTAGGLLRRSRRFLRTQRYVTGTVYVGLGVATAFSGSADDT